MFDYCGVVDVRLRPDDSCGDDQTLDERGLSWISRLFDDDEEDLEEEENPRRVLSDTLTNLSFDKVGRSQGMPLHGSWTVEEDHAPVLKVAVSGSKKRKRRRKKGTSDAVSSMKTSASSTSATSSSSTSTFASSPPKFFRKVMAKMFGSTTTARESRKVFSASTATASSAGSKLTVGVADEVKEMEESPIKSAPIERDEVFRRPLVARKNKRRATRPGSDVVTGSNPATVFPSESTQNRRSTICDSSGIPPILHPLTHLEPLSTPHISFSSCSVAVEAMEGMSISNHFHTDDEKGRICRAGDGSRPRGHTSSASSLTTASSTSNLTTASSYEFLSAPMATHLVIEDFHIRHADEMALSKGDQIYVEIETQGWMEGMNVKTGETHTFD